MCIIAVSRQGRRQPTVSEITRCFVNNPDGAGFMFVRAGGDGKVHIRKGFMTLDDYIDAIEYEHFTDADAVVYHCRISTQAGVNPQMTHPFPLTRDLNATKILSCRCNVGIAHNGIIPLTSRKDEHEYSDTALFVAGYMSDILRHSSDVYDESALDLIDDLSGNHSRFAILNGDGAIQLIGNWISADGVFFSNSSYKTIYKSSYFSLR